MAIKQIEMKKITIFYFLFLHISNLLLSQCNADRHSALLVDNWMSCEMSENPNSERGLSHWIMYNFGQSYTLNKSTIWNCNAFRQEDAGIQNYVIDYSSNGLDWNELGEYTLGQSLASTFYEGEAGPDFEGLDTQYILITALNTYGSSCACLSEIRFETSGISVSNIELNNLKLDLTLAPNPATNFVELRFNESLKMLDSEISILDQSGRIISNFEHTILKGNSTLNISTANFQSGNYLIKISSAEGITTRKLIIVKEHK